MGAREAHVVGGHRPKWRAYLLLARVSNLPTVWSNVLAGIAAAGSTTGEVLFSLAFSVSLFYVGGMFLNDAFDAGLDARQRPERPIPAGDVSRREAFVLGAALLLGGFSLLPRERTTLFFGLSLAMAILVYDYHHKGVRVAPLIMGLCRGLVYCIAGAATGGFTTTVAVAALVMTSYVAALTVVARIAGPNARWLVPTLIAGISLVDAGVILVTSSHDTWALVAATGFPLTLLLQRIVPGD